MFWNYGPDGFHEGLNQGFELAVLVAGTGVGQVIRDGRTQMPEVEGKGRGVGAAVSGVCDADQLVRGMGPQGIAEFDEDIGVGGMAGTAGDVGEGALGQGDQGEVGDKYGALVNFSQKGFGNGRGVGDCLGVLVGFQADIPRGVFKDGIQVQPLQGFVNCLPDKAAVQAEWGIGLPRVKHGQTVCHVVLIPQLWVLANGFVGVRG